MITCPKCKEEKLDTEFGFSSSRKSFGNRTRWCKSCINYANKSRYDNNKKSALAKTKRNKQRIRQFVLAIRAHASCIVCGESDPSTIDFHHFNSEDKKMDISMAHRRGFSIKNIEKELDKCVALCANCHRKLHAGNLKFTGDEVTS
jgi:hypothetical protein